MLLSESKWLRAQILQLDLPPQAKILNFGSQNLKTLKKKQPYVLDNIHYTTSMRSWQMLNFDLFPGEGVDISGNVLEQATFSHLVEYRFDGLYLFNVLEHVNDVGEICKRIQDLLPSGAYLLVSVPFEFPVHNDPIDNRFRPTPAQLAECFERCILIQSETVTDKDWLSCLSGDWQMALKYLVRLAIPFYRPRNWWTQVCLLTYLTKKFSVTCCVLRKR